MNIERNIADRTIAVPGSPQSVAKKLRITNVIFNVEDDNAEIHYAYFDVDGNKIYTHVRVVTVANVPQLGTFMTNRVPDMFPHLAASLGDTLL